MIIFIFSINFNSTNFNITITPNNVNLANATIYIWNSSDALINQTTNILTGVDANSTTWNIIFNNEEYEDVYRWNVQGCGYNGSVTTCLWNDFNETFTIGAEFNEYSFNSVIYGKRHLMCQVCWGFQQGKRV